MRVIDPGVFQLIPRHLFEQIEDFDADTIDRLYDYGSSILTQVVPNEAGELVRIPNPLVHIAVLIDSSHKIQGFLWAHIDVLDESIFIKAFSLEPKFQSANGEAMRRGRKYIDNLNIPERFKTKLKMSTKKVRAFERYGWRKSENTMMELDVKGELDG